MATIEERVIALETYFKVGLAVAAIMGVSGGWIGKTAYDALSAANKAQETAASAKTAVEHARDEAVKVVNESGAKAVASAVQKEVPAAVASQFDHLSTRIKLAFGQEQFIDYQKLDYSFDHKCRAGSVAVGWGYGSRSNDTSFFCKTLQVSVSGQ